MSIAEVQARMAAITAQFVAPTQVMPANSGAAFAAELAKVSASRPASAQAAAPMAGGAGSTGSTGSTAGSTATGSAAGVIAEAKSYLGVPYVWGGTNPKTGLDCSGLTQLVYGHAGVDLPRVSWQQARTGKPVDGLANARPGDLLAFNSPVDHVAIYLGDNRMIHAPKPGKSVEISDVYETPTAIRRVLPDVALNSGASALLGGIPV